MGVPADTHVADAHLLAALDAAVADTGRRVVWVQTHVDRSGAAARSTASWQLSPGPADDGTLLTRWALALTGPVGWRADVPVDGRVVRFPGSDDVPTRLTVHELLGRTAVDRVVGIGATAQPQDVVDTLDGFLRPTRTAHGVELLVEPAGPGRWRPVEISTPHQCCGGH